MLLLISVEPVENESKTNICLELCVNLKIHESNWCYGYHMKELIVVSFLTLRDVWHHKLASFQISYSSIACLIFLLPEILLPNHQDDEVISHPMYKNLIEDEVWIYPKSYTNPYPLCATFVGFLVHCVLFSLFS